MFNSRSQTELIFSLVSLTLALLYLPPILQAFPIFLTAVEGLQAQLRAIWDIQTLLAEIFGRKYI